MLSFTCTITLSIVVCFQGLFDIYECMGARLPYDFGGTVAISSPNISTTIPIQGWRYLKF